MLKFVQLVNVVKFHTQYNSPTFRVRTIEEMSLQVFPEYKSVTAPTYGMRWLVFSSFPYKVSVKLAGLTHFNFQRHTAKTPCNEYGVAQKSKPLPNYQ